MNRPLRTLGALSVLAGLSTIVAACAGATSTGTAPAAAPAAPAAEATAADAGTRQAAAGVFTLAQADRGRDGFDADCAACHSVRDFSGAAFLNRWANLPLGSFFGYVLTSMPDDSPGSLPRGEVSDIVAHILRVNGFPAGAEPLPSTTAELNLVLLTDPPPGEELRN